MTALKEITQGELTEAERASILGHAVDLHLLGSDEADHEGFDIIESRGERVRHLFRIVHEGKSAGVMYVVPFAGLAGHYEMTILIHDEFRGKHLTSDAVSQLETILRSRMKDAQALCAIVREHNPLRRELTEFLLRHGYRYVPDHLAFIKKL